MALRIITSALVGVVTFTLLLQIPTHAQAGLNITVQAEAVGISISGNGEYDFGGPWGSGSVLKAHPDPNAPASIVGLPPTLTNTGNMPIGYIELSYTGPVGQEASCDSGAAFWQAHATTPAQDRFRMRAWASNFGSWSSFNSNASNVAPGTGTGNILHGTSAPLAVSASIPLLLELRTPDPIVNGGAEGCTIGLEVTASTE